MKLKSSNKDLGEIAIEDIADLLSDLENINSFFILEKGNCSYIQCISYNGFIIIEERIYEDDSFNHYVLGHIEDCNCKINMDKTNNDKTSNGKTNSDKKNNNKANIGKNSLKDSLAIDDENFKIYNNETFTIREAIDIFTDYYSNFPLNYLKRRNISSNFPKLEKGYVFLKWLPSAVDDFKESLEEFIIAIEPFVIDELKKDCIAQKIDINHKTNNSKTNKINNNNNRSSNYSSNSNCIDDRHEQEGNNLINCSVFKTIDIQWAVESIIEIAEKYEFLEDIILYKKSSLEDNNFFKLNIQDFKE